MALNNNNGFINHLNQIKPLNLTMGKSVKFNNLTPLEVAYFSLLFSLINQTNNIHQNNKIKPLKFKLTYYKKIYCLYFNNNKGVVFLNLFNQLLIKNNCGNIINCDFNLFFIKLLYVDVNNYFSYFNLNKQPKTNNKIITV
jgi:hypothetical protein